MGRNWKDRTGNEGKRMEGRGWEGVKEGGTYRRKENGRKGVERCERGRNIWEEREWKEGGGKVG